MNYTSAIISDCTVSNNELHAYLYRGAGIYAGRSWNGVPPSIINCDIHSNRYASYGGGIQAEHSYVRIINNSICDNQSDHESGGINVWSSGPEIRSNYIAGNEGGSGGGIRIGNGTATIIGNMIVENEAGHGGGISEYSGAHIVIENNTISNNTASVRGGGIHTKNDSITIVNNIVWNNSAPLGSQLHLLAFADPTQAYVDYSNIMYGEDSVYIDTYASLNWGPGNIDADPLFESGPICDYHLSMSSPCVDAGNPSVEYNDPEDPFNPGYALWPAMGYLRNDMGAFGGGAVDYWLSAGEEEEEQGPSPGRGLTLRSFPNPFRASCAVSFQLEQPSRVNLSLYDLSGRLVEVLLEGHVPSGLHTEHIDGSGLSSGVYLIRLSTEDGSITRRCVVVR